MTFNEIFDRLMKSEGGYVNHPSDPGGETNWGISKRSYPHVDIKGLTRDGAKAIYFRDFWTPLNADELQDGVAFQLFDFAVNSGIGTSIRAFQRALSVADDGHFGPASLAASRKMSESDQIQRILAQRLRFMVRCKGWKDFGGGWANRIAENLEYGALDS
jgi:lysozyme family protein